MVEPQGRVLPFFNSFLVVGVFALVLIRVGILFFICFVSFLFCVEGWLPGVLGESSRGTHPLDFIT